MFGHSLPDNAGLGGERYMLPVHRREGRLASREIVP